MRYDTQPAALYATPVLSPVPLGGLPKTLADRKNDLTLSWGLHHPAAQRKRIWKLPEVEKSSDGHLLVCVPEVLTVGIDCILCSYFTA